VLGFWHGSSEATARQWSSAMFQGLPKLVDGWMAYRTLRRTRLHEPRCHSCPEKEKKGGWSLALAQVTFGRGRLCCSAADTMKKTSQGGAPEEKKRGEGIGGAGFTGGDEFVWRCLQVLRILA
jgi:hypothetical protein